MHQKGYYNIKVGEIQNEKPKLKVLNLAYFSFFFSIIHL